MAKTEQAILKEHVPAEVWIGRLSDLLKIVAAMDQGERAAAFSFLRSKYRSEWPYQD